jgi:hypothetical protein
MKRYSDELHAEVLRRIEQHQGEVFRQKKGKEFTYEMRARTLHLSTTKQNVGPGNVEKAVELMPSDKIPMPNKLRASSYLYGILMDDRIRNGLY